ncbi:uncharacterized protein LOC123537088, partial [Mercenaria mercenaria]|uniref:uncharacterized protein LOC123537088 n=1 Tax=Mercenaria mercenaria TaxID=6596 RepID=UPI00234F4759
MIQDALQRVGEKAYSILLNNCLHFCEEITGNGTVPPDIRTLERVRVTESDWNERCETPLSLSSHSSPGYNIEEINLMNNTGLQNWQGNGTSPLTNFFGSGAKTLTQDYSGGYIDTINLINTTGLQEWRQGNETCSLTNSYWGGAKTVFTQDYLGGYIDTINLINNTGLQEWRQGNGTCSLTNSYCIGTKTLFTQDYLGGYIDTVSKS